MSIVKKFKEAAREIAIVTTIGAAAAVYFIHEGVTPILAIGLCAAAVAISTIDYLRKTEQHDAPSHPVVHSKEIKAIRQERMQLRKELGIGDPK